MSAPWEPQDQCLPRIIERERSRGEERDIEREKGGEREEQRRRERHREGQRGR